MTTQITPGRYRGLKATSLADKDIFGIVAFDQRGSYRKMMPDGAPYHELVRVKKEIIGALSRNASAILTDPIYGLSPAMHMNGHAGLLFALEKSGYSGDSTYRKPEFFDAWTPEKVRKVGGNAAKILVYYNPQNQALADELDETIQEMVEVCHQWDLPLFVEPMSYSVDEAVSKNSPEFAQQKVDIVVETARRLSQTGADVLKMEFPVDQNHNDNLDDWWSACTQLSQASAIPWVLLSAGVDFEMFEKQTIVACESGASGFLAGRAIWKECATMITADRKAFLEDTATTRLNRLIEIAHDKARPWTDFYAVPDATDDWFESYN